MRRLRALIRKEFIHMTRDRRTLMSIFMMPILQLFLLGYSANTEVSNVSTLVVDQNQSQTSRQLLDAYRASGYFLLDHVGQSEKDAVAAIDRGDVKVAIIIPPDYSREVNANRVGIVGVLVDGSDPGIAGSAVANATLVAQSYGTKIRSEQLVSRTTASTSGLPVEVRTRVLYNPDLVSTYNMIPGLIGTILQMTTMMLTSLAIVRERERGTIEQLIVTPIRSWELMIAKITPYVLVSIINVALILIIGTAWFGVPIRGSILLLITLTGLFLLPNLGIGLLISAVAKTQQEAQSLLQPIFLPSMFLAGFLFPLAALPPFLQFVSIFIPLRYFLIIVRSVIVKGVGLEALMPQVIALVIFSVVLLVVAVRRFHKTLE